MESHYTPKWKCPCGRLNECAVTTCNQCSDDRPPILHGDPEQGDTFLGLARKIARGTYTKNDLSEANIIAKTWRSEINGYNVNNYKFDNDRGNQVSWQKYVEFLLGGGQV